MSSGELGGLSATELESLAGEPASDVSVSRAETESDFKGRSIAARAKKSLRAQDAKSKDALSPRGARFFKIVMTL